jgi:hypothetical protein
MTNCCDANGNCTQGKDCPIRKQRMEAANKAYSERGMVVDTNPYEDTLGTVKALISVITVCVIVTLIFFFWGK